MVLRLSELAEASKTNVSLRAALGELNKEWLETGAVGRRRATRDGLILPDAFNDAYQLMSKKLSELDNGDQPHSERGRSAMVIMESSRKQLEEIARTHLRRRV